MQFLLLLMVWCYIYKRQYTDKTLTLRKSMHMRASVERASLEIFAFSDSKTAISFIGTSDTLSQKHNIFRSQTKICMIPDIINAVPCYYLWYGVIYTKDSIPTKQ